MRFIGDAVAKNIGRAELPLRRRRGTAALPNYQPQFWPAECLHMVLLMAGQAGEVIFAAFRGLSIQTFVFSHHQ
jgi:hypothetical protein